MENNNAPQNKFGISQTNPLFVKSDLLAKEAYKITEKFPKHEVFGMTSQLRRAALSVVLNIVEGFARQSNNEFRRFLLIAFGSLKETGYLLYFAHKQKYIPSENYLSIEKLIQEITKIIWSIINKK